ncbi:TlpA family protein disulfide reductase [Chitinophaga sancti]|uniref:Peroxiredoxin n=1 Tax=Chitinophaga sancti TaxID=1004 RepID=A0A1K1SYV0_9BACT|nr:TlpA disulfide reductase family protein [Chitinophaga sancti]WQD62310.1 TlpA disulfide reductase family protein [Chitinophaga sancti]WQG92121.1 TlpA disulfide reductase family protein [Chitinophaga sancti]SFW89475.1 Peroxiredoxin [Chitinophaga sancti]
MKKIIFTVLMLSCLSTVAQRSEKKDTNSKLASLKHTKDKTVLNPKIKALENGSDQDLWTLIQYYDKNEVKKNEVTRMLLQKYPQSQNAQMVRITSFLKIKRMEDIEAHLQNMIKDYPNVNLDLEKSFVANMYANEMNPGKTLQYINSIDDPGFRLQALVMATEEMAAINDTKAMEFASGELENVKKMKDMAALNGPGKIDPQSAYDNFINLYGKLLFKAGKNEEAFRYTAEAYHNIKKKDEELIENYAFLSSLNGDYVQTLPILAKAVEEGKFEQRYIDQVKKGYTKLNPGKDADAYVHGLKNTFIKKIRANISSMMVHEAAPNFTVTDVNGKKVSLADFKGKTIVLDFWATWCGPCVESFPAMQMAANRYINDPDVKFLFIYTWNNIPDLLNDGKSFLAKRNYTFDLYLDPRNPDTKHSAAAEAFKIDGIPAKFIIDGKGKIRFKVSGFEGKAETAAEEVVQMVEMARK